MQAVLLDALKDSLKVFLVAFVVYFLLAFFAKKIINLLNKHSKIAPLFGALVGVVPECGVPVVGADLYSKRKITTGTIIAIFLACSDEAIPVLISSSKWKMVFLLVGIKILMGFTIGFLVDLITKEKPENKNDDELYNECCSLHKYLIHPLIDAFKVFIYVLIINILFGIIIYYIGEENIIAFLKANYLLSPLLAVLLGLVPNCAPSLLMAELYIMGGIPFGALLSGLAVNAGLGLIFLIKQHGMLKKTIFIVLVLIVSALLAGYLTIWI